MVLEPATLTLPPLAWASSITRAAAISSTSDLAS
jgi:hypothetical protein